MPELFLEAERVTAIPQIHDRVRMPQLMTVAAFEPCFCPIPAHDLLYPPYGKRSAIIGYEKAVIG